MGDLLCVEGMDVLHRACGCAVGGVQVAVRATGFEAQVGDISQVLRGAGKCGFGLGHAAVPRVCSAVH